MAEESTIQPLKEVWLLHDCSAHGGAEIKPRVFATLGRHEIEQVAYDIAEAYDSLGWVFDEVICSICKELDKGETRIDVEPSCGQDMDTFFLYKVEIDSGSDWAGTDSAPEPEEEDKTDVFVGSTIYASTAYYGDIEALYSTEWLDYMEPLKVE